jgi:hypothetical protein
MNPLDEAAEHLAEFESELAALDDGPFRVQGVTGNFVATVLPRIRATYVAMSQLLQAGHHDEMVVLFRRQLEDSMRLHYLAAHRDHADGLILGYQRIREMKVQRQLDRAINHSITPKSMIPELKRMVALRRDRIKHIDAQARQLGMEVEEFPGFEAMAAELGRSIDVIPYASAAEVSHSAVSAATDGYTTSEAGKDGAVRFVALRSENPSDRLGYARAAINSTSMALFHGLLLLNLRQEASYVRACAGPRIEALKARQTEISAERSDGRA